MKTLKTIALFGIIILLSIGYSCLHNSMHESMDKTTIEVTNNSIQDTIKVYLTLQFPNSVVGMFGIKEADTTGSKSQGFFYALKDSVYDLASSSELLGWQISFEEAPMGCEAAIKNGYKNGINIVEGSINTKYEVFDLSCVDGQNSILNVAVSDQKNWTTGNGSNLKVFSQVTLKPTLSKNYNLRGVFPYCCTDCIQVNPKDRPVNCFDLPINCSEERTCQVARTNHPGGSIRISYQGKSK
jgi:hypothetical protein